MTIDAVVVTYNRKEMLVKTISAILNQSYRVRFVYIIDNASTDGTYNYLSDMLTDRKIKYIRMNKNTGGAGGFYKGLEITKNTDWVWIMDDDVVPDSDCLEQLVKSLGIIDGKIAFLASTIYGPNGEPMNLPHISRRTEENGYAFWYKYLVNGIVSIRDATFVSLLINGEAIRNCGLPCKEFFIWGDDTEYSTRLTTYYGDAYFIGASKALHNRKDTKVLSLTEETNPNRRKMYHYLYRNNTINQKYYEKKYIFPRLCKEILKLIISPVIGRDISSQSIVVRGKMEAFLQYKKFKKYIDGQIGDNKERG